MKLPDFIFALAPPILAIVLQYFPLPSDRYLAQAAAVRQQKAGLAEPVKAMLLGMTQGSLAIAAFAPTLVSALVSAYALVYDRPDVAEYASMLLLLAIILGIVMASGLGGYEPYQLATDKLKAPFGIKKFLPFTCVTAINSTIYGVNVILILLAVAKFTGRLPLLHFLH
jgi:hypothetical protein